MGTRFSVALRVEHVTVEYKIQVGPALSEYG